MSLVDSDLNFVRNMRNHDIDIRKGNAWLGGRAAGCTMVFNRKLVELYANHNPEFCYHDYWTFLIALYFGNIVYDLDKDVLIREDASFRYLLDFKNSTSEIIIKEQDYHLNLKIDVLSVNKENKRREIYYNIESETQINNRIVLTFD